MAAEQTALSANHVIGAKPPRAPNANALKTTGPPRCPAPECTAVAHDACFKCGQAVCRQHLHKVRVVVRLGSVDPVHMCCGCIDDESTWRPDDSTRQCYECSRPFGVFRRRHHCRICGNIFCGDCSKYKRAVEVALPNPHCIRVRSCLPCSRANELGRKRSGTLAAHPRVAKSSSVDALFSATENSTYTADFFERFCQARDLASQSCSRAADQHQHDGDAPRGRQFSADKTTECFRRIDDVASDSSDDKPTRQRVAVRRE